jgi:hypothetical protein
VVSQEEKLEVLLHLRSRSWKYCCVLGGEAVLQNCCVLGVEARNITIQKEKLEVLLLLRIRSSKYCCVFGGEAGSIIALGVPSCSIRGATLQPIELAVREML